MANTAEADKQSSPEIRAAEELSLPEGTGR
jgi:hypothetical protein